MQIAFLITAHMPYLRRAGPSPAGEEHLHALIAQSLMPLITSLSDMRVAGLQPRVSLALAPLLLEQIADPVVQKHFLIWLAEQQASFSAAAAQHGADDENHTAYLARFYHEWANQVQHSFEGRYKRNLNLTLRDLMQAGIVEHIAAPATMACLPLLSSNASARVQIEQGIMATMRHLGRPQGIWLGGCGWRAGLEPMLDAGALRYAIVDPGLLSESDHPNLAWINSGTRDTRGRRIVALAADIKLKQHLARDLGYPGDPLYRAEATVGASAANGMGTPQPYDPYHAFRRAHEHAAHFVDLLVAEAELCAPDELMIIALDTSLIGASWFEGPTWLQAVLTNCATHASLSLTTPSEYLRRHRPQASVAIRPRLDVWPIARDYWVALHAAENELCALARQFSEPSDDQERVLNQAARELLLAQTGDWSAMLDQPSQRDANEARWYAYLDRCHELCAMARKPSLNSSDLYTLGQLEEYDGPFPTLNYRVFGT